MADFNTNVPLWGNKGTKPSDGLLKDGYAPNDRPTAQNTNFMYNAFSHAIKEVQDNVPLEANILNKTGDVIGGTILSAPKQLKYSINKGNAKVRGNVNHFSDVSGDSKITITIPKDVVIPGRQTLVFSFLHSFKGEVISLDFSSTYVSDFATTNTDNIKNDEYRKVRLSFTLGENAHNADIVIVMSARERNLVSCTIAEDFVTSGLIGVPYSLKADSLIALDEGAMLPKETLPTLDCSAIRTPYIGYTTNAVNAPQGEKLGTLMVFVTAETSKLTQVFTGNTSGKVYYRIMNIANTFSSWAEVLTGSALANALTNYATKEDLKTATAGMLTEESATNWQKFKVTQDNGFRVRLTDGTDLLTLKTGYYEVSKCKNSPFPDTETSWKNVDVIDGGEGRKMLRLTVSDRGNTFYKTIHTNSKGGRDWWQVADATATQSSKITADDGSSLTLSGYNLLNTSDVANFDGYVTTATNSPTTNNSGYFKRKYRAGYIEVTFSPHSSKDIYRNSYNASLSASSWVGWEKIITQSDTSTYQKQKITNDNGAPLYDLTSSTDLFAEITSWGDGFFTFYLSAGATNNPTGTNSWLRGRASTYGKNSDVLAYDKDGTMYIVVCANGIWGSWDKTAMSSKTQNLKITNDDGSSITVSGYDLLDVEDVKNYDGYVTNPKNTPPTSGSGYFKRKYREGYIEITFAPHSQKEVYRNSYNAATKKWAGWEKMVTSSEVSDITPVTLWEGSAQGGTGTYYKLKRPVTDFKRIKVWHSSSVYKYNVSEFYIPSPAESLDSFVIGATNLSNATGGSPTIYELGLDFSKVTSFTILHDSRYNVDNSEAILKSNATIIQKIEGIVR